MPSGGEAPPLRRPEGDAPLHTVQLGVQLAQVRRHSGDEDFHCGVGRADLEARLIGQHGEHWVHSQETHFTTLVCHLVYL